ncbi:MAG: prenyltransferase, partial [Lactobacillus johnsonii]|nr:prenyltransferase [Lactobacillus johnsonii]
MSAEAKQGYYELVEPRTLFNSIIPVLLGIMYTEYNFQLFRIFPTIEMCIA